MGQQKTVGRFQVKDFLGRGTISDVLLAWDPREQRLVALKVFHASETDTEILQAEKSGLILQAQLAAVAPQAPAVYEQGEDGETSWAAMEYVAETNLSEVLARGPLPEGRAVNIALELVSMLEVLHGFSAEIGGRRIVGVIHGDIRPENILLQDQDRVRLMEFPIAKHLSHKSRFEVDLSSSLPYSSPERLEEGVVDRHSDLWAIGVVLAAMVLGRRPFPGDTPEELEQAIRHGVPPLPLPPASSPGLSLIIGKALAFEPARRYQTAAELKADLAALRDHRPLAEQQYGSTVTADLVERRLPREDISEQYLSLLADDVERKALVACSAALSLSDETGRDAIELATGLTDAADLLLSEIKGLGCVQQEWDGRWYILEDVRLGLLCNLRELPATIEDRLYQLFASDAERRNLAFTEDSAMGHYRIRSARLQAAFQRCLVRGGQAQAGQDFLALWQAAQGMEKQVVAGAVAHMAYELELRTSSLPIEVVFLQGMAAQARGNERYATAVTTPSDDSPDRIASRSSSRRRPQDLKWRQRKDGNMIRLIKRYESRKLYDIEESRYVSLDEIAAWVRQGHEVHVLDNATSGDVTSQTLTQIILDESRRGTSSLPSELLHELVRLGERRVHTGVEEMSGLRSRLQQLETSIAALNSEVMVRMAEPPEAEAAALTHPASGGASPVDSDLRSPRERETANAVAKTGREPKPAEP